MCVSAPDNAGANAAQHLATIESSLNAVSDVSSVEIDGPPGGL
ncbi:hypothetical protein [Salinibacterium sp. PAMC 21357]|nr:hypothetical protein [Salinibacterium sp. PAMC 21357]